MNQNEVLLCSLTNVVKAFEMVTKQTALCERSRSLGSSVYESY